MIIICNFIVLNDGGKIMGTYANSHGTYSYASCHVTCSYTTCHGMCSYVNVHICFINWSHFGV